MHKILSASIKIDNIDKIELITINKLCIGKVFYYKSEEFMEKFYLPQSIERVKKIQIDQVMKKTSCRPLPLRE
jgi:hypothetical protein